MTSLLLSHCVLLNKQCAPRSNNSITPCIYQRFDCWMMYGFQWLLSYVFLIAAFTGFHDNSVSSLLAKFDEKLESRYETSFYSTQTRHYFIIFLLSYIINTSDRIRFKRFCRITCLHDIVSWQFAALISSFCSQNLTRTNFYFHCANSFLNLNLHTYVLINTSGK